jgi:hypothetical protein
VTAFGLGLLTGCNSAMTGASTSAPGHDGEASRPARSSPTTTTAPMPVTTTTLDQPGWNPVAVGSLGVEIDVRTVTTGDGSSIVVARFINRQVAFDLHVGSSDPPTGGLPISPDAGPSISADEAPLLLGAFNGGFMASAGVGGFEADGQVLRSLVPGEASFVIDGDGSAHVGVWGENLPAPGETVASVRQNLPPLVVNGAPSPQAGNVGAWGATVGGSYVARSSAGEDAAGNILFAASMSTVPADLASALISTGAVWGMQLDINPMWIDLTLGPTPDGPFTTFVPGQNRPADQYQVGWTRDFFVVVAAPG